MKINMYLLISKYILINRDKRKEENYENEFMFSIEAFFD
jgi:hypothetical protein